MRSRRTRLGMGISAAVLVVVLVVVVVLVTPRLLRAVLAGAMANHTGRDVTISAVRPHVLRWSPSLEIDRLSIRNTSWADTPVMFSADRITVSVSLRHLLGGHLVLPEVSVVRPVVNLERDRQGRASWEFGTRAGTPRNDHQPTRFPTILALRIDDGTLSLVDQIRKLRFNGSLVAAEEATASDPSAFRIRAHGSLNDKPFSLEVNGAPLRDLTPTTAYTFSANITAADIKLDAKVTVDEPFDLGRMQVGFEVAGNDLADLYYLTGLALPNTPPYRLAADTTVAGTTYTVEHISGRLGSSDLSGTLRVDTASKNPKLTGHLASKSLRLADLGPALGAAPRGPSESLAGAAQGAAPAGKPAETAQQKANDRLFSDAQLQVDRVRGMDADVDYAAGSVVVPRLPLRQVRMHLILDGGLLRIDPLSFGLDLGQFAGNVRIDARSDVPDSTIDMRLQNIDLTQFKSAAATSPPLVGMLQGRLRLEGHGDSLHQFASSSQGALSAIIPSGQINAGIAELTGIDVSRGLGLLLAKSQQKTAIRCSVIDFQDHQGILAEQSFFIDTTDVLIKGRGSINLQDEKLDLDIQGDPKHVRFTRIHAPITVRGTLAHPAIGVDVKDLAAQGGIAAALGTLLTPVAAVVAFIDPGLAKSKDCASALQQTSEPVASGNDSRAQ